MSYVGSGNGFGPNRTYGINDSGEICGVQLSPPQHAGVWSPSKGWTDIGGIPPTNIAAALSINNRGEAAGQFKAGDGTIHAFLYSPESGMVDLGLPSGSKWNLASDMNDAGQVAGSLVRSSDNQFKAYIRNQDGSYTYLDSIRGWGWSQLGGINASGMAVGEYRTPTIAHGFVYSPDWGMRDIEDLLDESAGGYQMGWCRAISDNGMIAADATIGGRQHAVLLVPVVPEPPSWLLLAPTALLLCFRRSRA